MEPEEEIPDSIDSRLILLRGIMTGYDWTFLLDVRDPMFVTRLTEALSFLGMSLRSDVETTVRDGDVYRCSASVEISCLGESRRFEASAVSDDPVMSAVLAGRNSFLEAGLMTRPNGIGPDGWTMEFTEGVL